MKIDKDALRFVILWDLLICVGIILGVGLAKGW
jgi:hypothetical protein